MTFAQLNLTPLLPEFARLHPGLSFELLLTDALLDLLDLVEERGRPSQGATPFGER